MLFAISQYNSEDFESTYSPEDNKLRLYADVRINKDDWQLMKKQGWRWAPKQELFFAFWTVTNEDFCLALAGDILPESMTMVERAEAKAGRLLILAQKRVGECVGYQNAANDLKNRLDNNQPILLGHHSQQKTEKVVAKIDRAIDKAKIAGAAVGYWVWRAQGVVGHADHKNAPRVIFGRIKTLLKDLRDAQKTINQAQHYLNIGLKLQNEADVDIKERMVKGLVGYIFSYEYSKKVERGGVSIFDALANILSSTSRIIHSTQRARYINHVLNRLAYEQSQLAITPRFDGIMTPAILQTFLRTHGADKPKVTKSDYGFIAESSVNLPLHIANGLTLELDGSQWCDLIQSLGYDVPIKKNQNPILNFKSDLPFIINKLYDKGKEELDQIVMTKVGHSDIHADRKRVRKSTCGTFRFRSVLINNETARGYWDTTEYAVFISDSKTHPSPDSMLLTLLGDEV